MTIAGVFRSQARACESLGSPFTARILNGVADMMQPGDPVIDRILGWQGDPTSAGDNVPLRLAGGLHALVLSGQDRTLSALYPPQPAPNDARLSDVLRATIAAHPAHFMHWLNSPPQTNEVGRSAVLIAAGHLLADRFGLPLRVLELGASAGLNFGWDRIGLKIGQDHFGARASRLVLTPDWTGDPPPRTPFAVIHRAGVDLNPLDPTNGDDRLRMMSYIWPDQTQRLERMRLALELAQAFPTPVDQGDAAGWVEQRLGTVAEGVTTVIYHTIAWQYFPQTTQDTAGQAIRAAGARATPKAPVAWFSMESDGRTDGAALRLRLWPGDATLDLGRADFHGRWVAWQNR